MIETTGTLFNKLNNRKNGEALLSQKQTAPTCARLLREILEKAKMSVSEWIAGANISKSYGYQILRGERTPGRDILLRTALVVQLSLKDTQRLLAVGGMWSTLSKSAPGCRSHFCAQPENDPPRNGRADFLLAGTESL